MYRKQDRLYLGATIASFSMHAFVVTKLIGDQPTRTKWPLVGISAVSIIIQSTVARELLASRQHLYDQGSYLAKLIERHANTDTPTLITLDEFDVIAMSDLFGYQRDEEEAEDED